MAAKKKSTTEGTTLDVLDVKHGRLEAFVVGEGTRPASFTTV